MRTLPDASVDMILCDLPYGTSACKWDSVIPFEPLWEQYKRIIKYRGAIVLFGSEPFSSALRMSNLDMYKYDWKWEKPSGANFLNFKYQPAKVHEDIMVFGMAPTSYVKSGINMLQNGTVINGTLVEKPHSFATACNIATQIMAQVASNQYGGQSESLAHLVPFIDISRQRIRKNVEDELQDVECGSDTIERITEDRLKEEIRRGVQTIQYQINTLMTTNGQTPFVTIFMYLDEVPEGRARDDFAMLIEEVLNQRIEGVKNEKGVWITPAFPKIIYVLEEDNIHDDSKYWYLTKLAAKCTAKRMVPDYISEKKMKELKVDENGDGHCYTCMGCRSFLTPYIDENGRPKYYGRFNQGVVTINLVDVGLSANKDYDRFWKIFDERLELFFKYGECVSVVQTLDANMSDEEARHVAFAAINKHCKEENEPVYYVRMWNNETATMFDFGSHSEFFMLVPKIEVG